MADNAITLQGLSAITRFIGRSTFQTQVQDWVLRWFVITTNHPLKSEAVWLFPGTSLEKEPPRVCPLERDELLRHFAVFAGLFATLQLQPHRFLKRRQLWRRLMQCSFGTCPSSNDETVCLVYSFESHVQDQDDDRKVDMQIQRAANDSEPSLLASVIRVFGVLTAPDFQEKKR
jgi:hypothetical protein